MSEHNHWTFDFARFGWFVDLYSWSFEKIRAWAYEFGPFTSWEKMEMLNCERDGRNRADVLAYLEALPTGDNFYEANAVRQEFRQLAKWDGDRAWKDVMDVL